MSRRRVYGKVPVPSETTDIVKLLREAGLRVEHSVPSDRRVQVGRWSADFLLPILMFAQQALANGAGNLLADAIRQRLHTMLPGQRLHVRVAKVRTDDMDADWFEGDGPAEDVIEAMRHAIGG